MSCISFHKGYKTKFKSVLWKKTDSIKIKLKKEYHAVYNILCSTNIFPKVINELTNEYLRDVLVFEMDVVFSEDDRRFIRIYDYDVNIGFKKYNFVIEYDEVSYQHDKVLNVISNIFGDDYLEQMSFGVLNFYMKHVYNKQKYIHFDNKYVHWSKYTFSNKNTIEVEYPDDDLNECCNTITISNHKKMKNLAVIVRLFVDTIQRKE